MTTKHLNNNYGMSLRIGETCNGISTPVFFDPHYAVRINRPPITLITGAPGGGKTMLSALMAAHSSVLNKITIVLDPKGDFISLRQLFVNGEINDVSVWSIFQNSETQEIDERNIGALDPTCLTDSTSVNSSLTLTTIETLSKELSNKQRNLLIPIIKDVTEGPNPSFAKIRMVLLRHQDTDMAAIGQSLGLDLDLPAGRLLVAPRERRFKLNLADGTTIVSLMGLKLPSSSKKEESYSGNERLSVAIMAMITHLILDVMKSLPKSINKTLIIDEAWAVFRNESGQNLIDEVSLLGRSLNMATILATQSPSHIEPKKADDVSIESTISNRFAFRTGSQTESTKLVKDLRLPQKSGYESLFNDLQQGKCIMSDVAGQIAMVDILISDEWLKILSTTPEASG